MTPETPLGCLELFTGGGGLALGLDMAGFAHLALVELDRNACATLRKNVPRRAEDGHPWPIHEIDAKRFDYNQFVDRVDLLAAGVPCQPFSLGGRHRGNADKRNLFPLVFDVIRTARPKAILIENVPGLVRPSFLPYFEYIVAQLRCPTVGSRKGESWTSHKARLLKVPQSQHQYDVAHKIVECADYGTPQTRRRVLIVGFRCDLNTEWSWPEPTHSEDSLLYAKWIGESYWKEHKIEPRRTPKVLESRVASLRAAGKPTAERWRTVRDALRGLPEPVHGQPHPAILNHVGIPGARVYPGHTGSDLDWPAKTLKAGVHGVPGGEGTVVLDDGRVRYFSVREAARIQGFPDDYEIVGVRSEAMRQIGNAVPVNVAKFFGEAVLTRLRAGR